MNDDRNATMAEALRLTRAGRLRGLGAAAAESRAGSPFPRTGRIGAAGMVSPAR